MTKFLTAKEVAARRRRTPQALTMERQRGTGPPYFIDNGRILYAEDEVEKWLEDHRVDPAKLTKRSRRTGPVRSTLTAPPARGGAA